MSQNTNPSTPTSTLKYYPPLGKGTVHTVDPINRDGFYVSLWQRGDNRRAYIKADYKAVGVLDLNTGEIESITRVTVRGINSANSLVAALEAAGISVEYIMSYFNGE